MNLDNAVVYDVETFPNCFTLYAENLNDRYGQVWEISEYKDDSKSLIQWFNMLRTHQTPMIGFNNIGFDLPIIDYIYRRPHVAVASIYEFAMSIIQGNRVNIWANERFAPQIDLFKMFHFNNKAKSTSLKALQINMRSKSVVDMPVEVGTNLSREQIDKLLIPYNIHDVKKTKEFASISHKAIKFRQSLIQQFGVEAMNYPDTKIGEQIMIQKLGNELCYTREDGRRKPRQTIRTKIALKDIIFPYIKFETEGFNKVLNYLQQQTLTVNELKRLEFGEIPRVETKGIFKGLTATYQGVEFHFGTGGLHGSVDSKKVISSEQFLIRDIDVASLYPSIAIVNKLYPEHLGEHFTNVYSEIPKERKHWQKTSGKKCPEANALKLAANGIYGNSNNPYSVFFDSLYTMKTTVNGQLMLCMLIEKLATVPTLQLIQANTDGITYYIDKDYEPFAAKLCQEWEAYTLLVLEDADYNRMWIRDVNNYVAEDKEGNLKLKGAYWYPDPINYEDAVSESQPPAWHKDLSALVCIRAAVEHMVNGVDIEQYIKMTFNPFDFMYRIKVRRSDKLYHGAIEQQKNSRYFVSNTGDQLYKIAPPKGKQGAYKKKNGVTDHEYEKVMNQNNWEWSEEVCTKNKSTYETVRTAIQAGQNVTMCNDVDEFDFTNINYDWYIEQACKLVIN